MTLIERTTRAQRLTEAGTTLLHHVETLLDAAADLDNAMRIAPGPLDPNPADYVEVQFVLKTTNDQSPKLKSFAIAFASFLKRSP